MTFEDKYHFIKDLEVPLILCCKRIYSFASEAYRKAKNRKKIYAQMVNF